MTPSEFENKIAQTIQKLSDPESYQIVCHQHTMGEPLPSIAKLGQVINLVREIL